MDSFGTWRKWKKKLCVNAEFYRVVWTINTLLTDRSEMVQFSGNNQNIKMFGVPPNTLPFVVYIMIICHWAICIQYVMPNNCRKVWWCFWWVPALSENQEKKLSNSPKLSCGFKTTRRTLSSMKLIVELIHVYSTCAQCTCILTTRIGAAVFVQRCYFLIF